jgi:hypothetical protein
MAGRMGKAIIILNLKIMKKIFLTSLLFLFCFLSCKKNNTGGTPQPLINDKSIDSFNVNLEPIGDVSGGSFSQFHASATGYLSLFKKDVYEKVGAKSNHTLIDLVYYTSGTNSTSNNGKIHFSNPTVLDGGLGPDFNLGWPSYSDKPQFVATIKSKRYDSNTGIYYALSEEEFDALVTPEAIHGFFIHSLNNGSEKKSNYTIDYFANKTERTVIFGMLDTKGMESIIKIKQDQSISHLFTKVKRSYSN